MMRFKHLTQMDNNGKTTQGQTHIVELNPELQFEAASVWSSMKYVPQNTNNF